MLSVIVPIYQAEKYLERCMSSLLSQTIKDLEIILVDDGSSDGSGAICDQYSAAYSNILTYHQDNGGVSSARNKGLDSAHGEYIMFCDPDDIVSPFWCESLYAAIIKNPLSFVACQYKKVEQSEIIEQSRYGQFDAIILPYISRGCMLGAVWNTIFSKSVIDRFHLRFDENMVVCEDMCFVAEYIKHTDHRFFFIEEPLYYYYMNAESAVHRFQPNMLQDRLKGFYAMAQNIEIERLGAFCDDFLFEFINFLDYVFDSRNTMCLLEKLRYNQRAINSKEFDYLIKHIDGKKESKKTIGLLKFKNYYLYWAFTRLSRAVA